MSTAKVRRVPLESTPDEKERLFFEFYYHVIKQQYDISDSTFLKRVKHSLRMIRLRRCFERRSAGTDVSFEDDATRCAYLHGYSAILSSAVTYHFSKFLKNNYDKTAKLTRMRKLRLCCLGGGSTIEAVAICKVINDLFAGFGAKRRPPLNVYVTVIDECEHWKDDASAVMGTVEKYSGLCDEENMKLHFEFLHADFKQPLSEVVLGALRKAHIVTMVKFLSSVYDSKRMERSDLLHKICGILNDIVSYVKPGCCVFCLDYAGGETFKSVDRVMQQSIEVSQIYGPSLRIHHFLYDESVYKELFKEALQYGIMCTKQTIISCEVWEKNEFHAGNVPPICTINPPVTRTKNCSSNNRRHYVRIAQEDFNEVLDLPRWRDFALYSKKCERRMVYSKIHLLYS